MANEPSHIDIYSRVTIWARHLGQHYYWVLIVASLITAGSVQVMRKLRFNSDLADLLPANHPDLKILRRIQAKYSTDTGFMVLLSKNYTFVADDQGTVHLHDGSRWQSWSLGAPLYALWGASPVEAYAGGEAGKIFRYDGARWTSMAPETRATLRGLWGSSTRQIFAAGDGGVILHLDGGRWLPLASPTKQNLHGIAGAGAEVFAVGEKGTILRFDGQRFVLEDSGTTADLYGVWAGGNGEAFAVGQGGTFLHRSDGKWRAQRTPVSTPLRAIWGADEKNVHAAGDAGVLLFFDGKKVVRKAPQRAADYRALHGTQAHDLWAAGTDCTLQRFDEKWYEGPVDPIPPEDQPKWYSLFVRKKKPVCHARYTAIFRPRADLDRVKTFAPRLAALLEKSALVSRVDYKKPLSYFKERALYFLAVEDLERLRDTVEESLERETAKGTGLYVDLEEERSEESKKELLGIYGKYQKLASSFGASEWYSPPDNASIGLVIWPAKSCSDFENLRELQHEIERVVAQSGYAQADPLMRVDIGGDGLGKIREYDSTLHDIFGTLWIPIVGITLLIFIYFRRPIGLVLTIVPLAMAICWTGAVTTLLIGTLNYVTGFLFAVLFGLGIDYGIQLYSRYREGRGAGLSPDDAMNHVVLDTGRATLTSAFTTSAALLTMVITDFKGFSEFGLIAGIGIVLAFFSYLLVLPSLILLCERFHVLRIPVSQTRATTEEIAPGQEPFRLPRVIFAASILMTIFGLYGSRFLSFEYDNRKLRPVRLLDEVERRTTSALGQSFNPTLLVADSRQELEAAVSAIRRRKENLGKRSTVENVVTLLDLVPGRQHEKQTLLRDLDSLLHDKRWNLVSDKVQKKAHLQELRDLSRAKPFGLEELPPTVRRAFRGPGYGEVWLALVFHRMDLGHTLEARELKEEVGSFEGTPWINLGSVLPEGARVSVEQDRAEIRCPDPGHPCIEEVRSKLLALRHHHRPVFSQVIDREEAYRRKLAVRDGLRGDVLALAPGFLIRDQKAPEAIQPSGTFHVSSGELVLAEVVEVLLHDGRIAFLVSIVAVFLLILIDFRSLKYALLASLPLCLGMIWTFGLMHLTGIKLNMFNFVILPAMMGIGIDYGVHYIHRYRTEGEGNLGRVMRSLYWVIFFCAATTVVGFGNVTIASHPGLQSLGNLAIISLSCIFFASTYTLPSLLYLLERVKGIAPRAALDGLEVILYSTSYCPSCRLVRRFLTDRGIRFTCIELDTLPPDERQRIATELIHAAGADALPVTKVANRYLVGFNPSALEEMLASRSVEKRQG